MTGSLNRSSRKYRLVGGVLALGLALLSLRAWALTPPPGTPIVNRASAQFADLNGHQRPASFGEAVTVIAGAPRLRIAKSASSNPVAAGAALTYTIRYENTGNDTAAAVTVTDRLSRHLIFLSASGGGLYAAGPPDGGQVTWNLGALRPGAAGELTLQVRVRTPSEYPPGDPEAGAAGTVITNTVEIVSPLSSASATAATVIGLAPNLLLEKVGAPAVVQPGGEITYQVAYRNLGNAPAESVRVYDLLPEGTSCQPGSITGPGVLQDRTIAWELGRLEPGAAGILSFRVAVSSGLAEGQSIVNRASATSSSQPPVLSNDWVTHVSSLTSLSIEKGAAPAAIQSGNLVTYTIRVANDGQADLNGVIISDPLPANTTFEAADNGGLLSGGRVTWNLGSLAAGAERVLTLLLRAGAAGNGGTIINTAYAEAGGRPFGSASAQVLLSARTPGLITFNDPATGESVRTYHVGDPVCVQIFDPDRNTDPGQVETITALLLVSAAGDYETVSLTEVNPLDGTPSPDSGFFRVCLPSNEGPAAVQDGQLTLVRDALLVARYQDPLDGLYGLPVEAEAQIYIDPYGVVFDSVSGAPVAGATVTLYQSGGARASLVPGWPAGQPDQVTTAADGQFAFPLVPAGDFYLEVEPPAPYTFPSLVPDAQLPAGFAVVTGSRGEIFTLTAGMEPLNLDLPIDPQPGELKLEKSVNRTAAAIGDFLAYTIKITNPGPTPVTGIRLRDILPVGFQLVKGSSRFNAVPAPDPVPESARTLAWELPPLAAGETLEVSYRVLVGPDSRTGEGRNRAQAAGSSAGRPVLSNPAAVSVQVSEGLFTSRGTIIGKVFLDLDGDRLQGLSGAAGNDTGFAERGIPDAVIYLENGTRVVTDRDGKFSIPGIESGTHVLRLDASTLPAGTTPVPADNRAAGDGLSRFAELAPGGLAKSNFILRPAATAAAAGPTAPAQPVIPAETPALEEQIKTLPPGLAFLTPADGAWLPSGRASVLVKAPADLNLTLRINGRAVPPERIGRRVTYQAANLAVYEFVGLELESGETNRLRAELRDPFGNLRAAQEISVGVIGRPERIELKSESSRAPADGRSSVPVSILLYDRNGRPAAGRHLVTLAASAGEFEGPDADPASPGFQVQVRDGAGQVRLRAPFEPAAAELTAEFEAAAGRVTIDFEAHRRDLLLVGLGELVFGHGEGQGDLERLKNRRWLEEGFYSGGRAAFFLKGEVAGGLLLTGSYDSEKDRRDLDRAAETNPNLESRYPIYGDASRVGYETVSSDKLYLRLEKSRFYALYGDFATGFKSSRSAAYERSFTGFKTETAAGPFQVKAFAARTDQVRVVDALPGRSSSGYYYLTYPRRLGGQVIEGSEQVVIETRDRYRPDRILKRESQTRWYDYEIDYERGALLFKSAVPGRDQDFNPVYIVVSYELDGTGRNYYIYGGRAAWKAGPALEVGLTSITEEKEMRDYRLSGLDLTLALPGRTRLRADLSASRSLLEASGQMLPADGSAASVELESRPIERLSLAAYYRRAGKAFDNPSALDLFRGTEKYGLEAGFTARPDLRFKGKFFRESDWLNHTEHSHAEVEAEKDFGRTRARLGLLVEESDDRLQPAWLPFDASQETPDRITALTLGLDSKLSEKLSLKLAHLHDLAHGDYTRSQAGLEYRYDSHTRFYLGQELSDLGGRSETRGRLGVESDLGRDLTAYSEYRLESAADGRRNQNVIGLRNRFRFGRDLTGNFSFENLTTLDGPDRTGESDGYGLALGLEYLADNLKATSRLEYRNHDDERSHLAELGLATRLTGDLTFLARERWFYDDFGADGRNVQSSLLFGLAYRPVKQDRFQALAKLELKTDHDSTGTAATDSDALLLALEGHYQPASHLQFSAKYAGKSVRESGLSAYTDLVAGRVVWDLNDRFDLGLEYRVLNSRKVDTLLQGGTLELGLRLVQNLRLALGYSFDDFDPDLTGDAYRGQGPYLALRFKFDERLLTPFRRK